MIDFDDADDPPEVRIDRLRAYVETCKHSTAFHAERSAEKSREIDRLRALVAELAEIAKPDCSTDATHKLRLIRASLAKSQGHPPHGPGVTGV
jgi:hypothetical protein